MAKNLNGKALRQILGDGVVIRYSDGYHVNPDGTGTRALHPAQEQMVISRLSFPEIGGKFPLPDETLVKSGISFKYQGF